MSRQVATYWPMCCWWHLWPLELVSAMATVSKSYADSRTVGLKLQRKLKIALLGVLSMSLLVIVAAFVRMFMVQSFNNSTDRSCEYFGNIFECRQELTYSS